MKLSNVDIDVTIGHWMKEVEITFNAPGKPEMVLSLYPEENADMDFNPSFKGIGSISSSHPIRFATVLREYLGLEDIYLGEELKD